MIMKPEIPEGLIKFLDLPNYKFEFLYPDVLHTLKKSLFDRGVRIRLPNVLTAFRLLEALHNDTKGEFEALSKKKHKQDDDWKESIEIKRKISTKQLVEWLFGPDNEHSFIRPINNEKTIANKKTDYQLKLSCLRKIEQALAKIRDPEIIKFVICGRKNCVITIILSFGFYALMDKLNEVKKLAKDSKRYYRVFLEHYQFIYSFRDNETLFDFTLKSIESCKEYFIQIARNQAQAYFLQFNKPYTAQHLITSSERDKIKEDFIISTIKTTIEAFKKDANSVIDEPKILSTEPVVKLISFLKSRIKGLKANNYKKVEYLFEKDKVNPIYYLQSLSILVLNHIVLPAKYEAKAPIEEWLSVYFDSEFKNLGIPVKDQSISAIAPVAQTQNKHKAANLTSASSFYVEAANYTPPMNREVNSYETARAAQ